MVFCIALERLRSSLEAYSRAPFVSRELSDNSLLGKSLRAGVVHEDVSCSFGSVRIGDYRVVYVYCSR